MNSVGPLLILLGCLVFIGIRYKHIEFTEESNGIRATSISDINPNSDDDKKCQIYLAASSIPKSGMGIFTTKSIPKGGMILDADSPGIPVIDKFWRNLEADMFLFGDKSWPERNGVFDAMRYEAESVFEVSFNLGAFPNYHPYLHNMELVPHENAFDDSLVNRSSNPGAGAFSEYMGKSVLANRDLKAGEELFLNYGNAETYLAKIPGMDDYDKAGMILAKLHKDIEILKDKDVSSTSNEAEKLREMLYHMHAIVPIFSENVDSLLPSTLPQLKQLIEETEGKFKKKSLSFAAARTVSTTRRSVEWLEKEGMCLDNIIPDISTLPHAGRGAFAHREISEGEIIVPTPLLHIANRDVLGTYQMFVHEENRIGRDQSKYVGKQLLLNYCFGHKESSLLFCPESNGVYINHCSKRKKQCKKGPNASYRWASGWDKTQDSLKMTYDEVAKVCKDLKPCIRKNGLKFVVKQITTTSFPFTFPLFSISKGAISQSSII